MNRYRICLRKLNTALITGWQPQRCRPNAHSDLLQQHRQKYNARRILRRDWLKPPLWFQSFILYALRRNSNRIEQSTVNRIEVNQINPSPPLAKLLTREGGRSPPQVIIMKIPTTRKWYSCILLQLSHLWGRCFEITSKRKCGVSKSKKDSYWKKSNESFDRIQWQSHPMLFAI